MIIKNTQFIEYQKIISKLCVTGFTMPKLLQRQVIMTK